MTAKRSNDRDSKKSIKDEHKPQPQTSETVQLSAEELKKVSGGAGQPAPPPRDK